MLRVVKLGGSTLATPQQVRRMALALAGLQKKNERVVAVVSAMGKTTDLLYEQLVGAAGDKVDPLDLEHFLSQGEWASAQLMTAALKALGRRAIAVTPWDKDWPLKIILKDKAVPLKEKANEIRNFKLQPASPKLIRQVLGGHLKAGVLPVVCGFVAKNQDDQVVTLGRGGSDVSAFLLANVLKADEVILVKDVDGVLAWDPGLAKVSTQAKISVLKDRELYLLTSAGARVAHPGALRYMSHGSKARIVSSESPNWTGGGTEVVKTRGTRLKRLGIRLAALTFIGRDLTKTPGILHAISGPLKALGISIYSVTVSESFLALYVPEKDIDKAYAALAGISNAVAEIKSSAVKKGLAKITVESQASIETPGTIERLVRPLAQAGINIWELVTVHSDISFFVESSLEGRAIEVLKKVL
ncbi:MAG: ACT domain-containing protein [Elusimicrobia bacterium]|nr:ACT domain-containing protein [Elusimicrobiota bacterium]